MKRVVFAVAIAASAVAVMGAAVATAVNTGAAPTITEISWDPHNKPTCPGGTAFAKKVEPVVSGNYGPVQITVNGSSFNWAILPQYLDDYDMGVVMVKGGPSLVKVYTYTDPANDSWDGLTAVTNPANQKPYGLSHIYLCLDPKA